MKRRLGCNLVARRGSRCRDLEFANVWRIRRRCRSPRYSPDGILDQLFERTAHVADARAATGKRLKMSIEVVTFGCRLNAAESEVIRREADALDNAVVVNTCAVTAEAVRQARQSIRKLRRERPDARIVVTGCAAQIDPQSFAAMPEVDRVVGNEEKLTAATWVGTWAAPD